MRAAGILCALVLLTAGAGAQAHAHLERAEPADGSVLHAAPRQLVLTFSQPARLTVLWIEPADGKRLKLTGLATEAARQISVALPALAPGRYTVSWR
ncbi:MAG: copper resistance CopC family protein, partial [Steroidobacteraceae bacterium]